MEHRRNLIQKPPARRSATLALRRIESGQSHHTDLRRTIHPNRKSFGWIRPKGSLPQQNADTSRR